MGDINACGPRFFRVNGVDTTLTSNTFTVQPTAVVGTQTFDLSMGIINYPLISPITATLTINVVDLCSTTVIDALTPQPAVTVNFPQPGSTIITVVVPGNSASTAAANAALCGALVLYVNGVITTLDASN